jgi:hypothetical protein
LSIVSQLWRLALAALANSVPDSAQLAAVQRPCYHTIIGETIDAVQERVVAPYARLMGIVDVVCGPLDEWCTARLIRNWREDVWRQALAIIEAGEAARRDELRREADLIALRRVALLTEGGALGARVFGYPLRHLHRLRLL